MAEIILTAEPALAYLPALLAYFHPMRMVYDDILWHYEGGCWKGLCREAVPPFVARALREIIGAMPPEEQAAAKAATSNVRRRKPLVDALYVALAERPKITWNPIGQVAVIIDNNRFVFDLHTGEKRGLRPTDYIHDNTYNYLPIYTPIRDQERMIIDGLPEHARFLLDAMAYALHGRPTNRAYYVCGPYADVILHRVVSFMHSYAATVTHYYRRRYAVSDPLKYITQHRIVIMQNPRVDDMNVDVLQNLTDGSGIYNGDTNIATLFYVKNEKTITITDPLILSRLVFVNLSALEWIPNVQVVAYLIERAIKLDAPPPIPPSMEDTSLSSWAKIPLEEWLKGALEAAEGITKQAAWDAYQVAHGRSPRIENVKKDMFFHLLEKVVGPAKKVRGILTYVGWTLKI